MSSVDLNAAAQQSFANNYILLASCVTTCYDHILTIGIETRLIWRKPMHIVLIAFLAVRYLTTFASIIRLILLFKTSSPQVLSSICLSAWVHLIFTLTVVTLALTMEYLCYDMCHTTDNLRHVFFFIVPPYTWIWQFWRVSVLYSHDKDFLYKTVPLFLIVMGFSLWPIVTGPPTVYGYNHDCIMAGYTKQHNKVYAVLIGWLVLFIWDIFVIVLTVSKTWQTVRIASEIHHRHQKSFISTVLLRDSLMYFLARATLTLANLVNFAINSSVVPKGAFLWLTTSMSILLTSRLLLNLKENLNTDIPSRGIDTNNTVDVAMSDIVFQQLGSE